MNLPPVAATTVGSFPRPGWLVHSHSSPNSLEVEFALEGDALLEAQPSSSNTPFYQLLPNSQEADSRASLLA